MFKTPKETAKRISFSQTFAIKTKETAKQKKLSCFFVSFDVQKKQSFKRSKKQFSCISPKQQTNTQASLFESFEFFDVPKLKRSDK